MPGEQREPIEIDQHCDFTRSCMPLAPVERRGRNLPTRILPDNG